MANDGSMTDEEFTATPEVLYMAFYLTGQRLAFGNLQRWLLLHRLPGRDTVMKLH
jgi:hypothetical protein